jgi:hypothetical protein
MNRSTRSSRSFTADSLPVCKPNTKPHDGKPKLRRKPAKAAKATEAKAAE